MRENFEHCEFDAHSSFFPLTFPERQKKQHVSLFAFLESTISRCRNNHAHQSSLNFSSTFKCPDLDTKYF